MEEKQIDKHIAVLDGLRVISLIFIVWIHFWEQTWLTPYINFNNDLQDTLELQKVICSYLSDLVQCSRTSLFC